MFRSIIAVVVVGTLGLGGALAGALPASAAPVIVHSERAPDPGGGKVWGAPLESLPAQCDQVPDTGGWANRAYVNRGRLESGPGFLAKPSTIQGGIYDGKAIGTRPDVISLAEPCQPPASQPSQVPNLGWRLTQLRYASDSTTGKVTEAATGYFLAVKDQYTSSVVCATTEWSDASTQTVRLPSYSAATYLGSFSEYLRADLPVLKSTEAGGGFAAGGTWINYSPYNPRCDYVVSVTVTYCASTANRDGAAQCSSTVWSADRWFRGVAYDKSSGGSNPEYLLCWNDYKGPNCDAILSDGAADGSQMSVACPSVPAIPTEWWLWLPEAVGYYAVCLFNPLNGFDRLKWVQKAWEGGAGGSVGGALSAVAAGFHISSACGVIVSTAGIPVLAKAMPNFTVDTCGWTWAAGFKNALGIFLTLMSAYWMLGFVVSTVIGLLNRRTRNPISAAAEE